MVRAKGFLAAGFRHRTSRSGDPSSTPTSCPERRWPARRAVVRPDVRQLYLWQKAATAMYHSALRAELAPLGVPGTSGATAWGNSTIFRETSCGRSPSAGSKSRRLARGKGLRSQRAAEVAALATRGPHKSASRPERPMRFARAGKRSLPSHLGTMSPTRPQGRRGRRHRPIHPGAVGAARWCRCPRRSARRTWPSSLASGRWTWRIRPRRSTAPRVTPLTLVRLDLHPP